MVNEMRKLNELADIFSGNSIPKKKKEELFCGLDEGTPYVATKDVGLDNSIHYENGILIPEAHKDSFRLAPANSVLICAEGGSAGKKVAHNDKDIHFVNKLFCVHPNEQMISKYIFYYFLSADFKSDFKNQITGLIGGVSLRKFKNLCIPYTSLEEQKRIVALLDTVIADLEQARTKTEQNLKNVRELFDSYLQYVFSQKGEGWAVKKVSDIADTCLGKMLDKKKNKGNFEPYLRNLNVQWFSINTDNLLDMRFEDSEYERYAVKKGDLVICEGGYPGRGAIWEQDEDIFFQKALHRIRSHDVIYNQWILYYLYLSDRNGSLKSNFTGAGIQHFTGKALKQLSLPVPDKVKAEKYIYKIDEIFKKVKHLEDIYQQKLNSIDELKKSILQKAFNGELTTTIK